MAIAFLIIGIALIVSAIRNTYGTLGSLLAGDLTGSNSFLYWLALLVIVGGLGLIPQLRAPSRLLLGLIILAYLLKNGGFWSKLTQALSQGPTAEPAQATTLQTPTTGLPVDITVHGGSGASSGGSGATDALGGIAKAIPLIGGFL